MRSGRAWMPLAGANVPQEAKLRYCDHPCFVCPAACSGYASWVKPGIHLDTCGADPSAALWLPEFNDKGAGECTEEAGGGWITCIHTLRLSSTQSVPFYACRMCEIASCQGPKDSCGKGCCWSSAVAPLVGPGLWLLSASPT